MNLDAVISRALVMSSPLKELHYQQKIKQTEVRIAISEMLPQLSTEFTLNASDYEVAGRDPLAVIDIAGDPVSVFPTTPSKYTSDASVSFVQTLFSGGRLFSQFQLKLLELEKASMSIAAHESEERIQATSLYWKTVQAKEEMALARLLSELTHQQRSAIQEQSIQGFLQQKKLREIDLDYIHRVDVQDLKERHVESLLGQLQETLHHDTVSIVEETLSFDFNVYHSFFSRLKTLALSTPSLKEKLAALDMAIQNKQHEIEKSRHYPRVILSGGVEYFDSSSHFDKSYDHLNKGNTYVQLAVQYDLFTGFRNAATVRKSSFQNLVFETRLKSAKQDSFLMLSTLIQECEDALKQCQYRQTHLDSLEQLLEETNIRFQQNQISKSDIIDTRIRLVESEILYKKSIISLEIQLSQLAFRIGEGDVYMGRFVENE